jgi:hypothetical protein
MSEQLVKLISEEVSVSDGWVEVFREKYIPRIRNVVLSSKTDSQLMILAINSQDYVGMLVHGLAKNYSEAKEIISDQDFKILGLPFLMGRQILDLAYSFLSLEFDSVEKLNLDNSKNPVVIFSDSNLLLIDSELPIGQI